MKNLMFLFLIIFSYQSKADFDIKLIEEIDICIQLDDIKNRNYSYNQLIKILDKHKMNTYWVGKTIGANTFNELREIVFKSGYTSEFTNRNCQNLFNSVFESTSTPGIWLP